MLLGFIPGVGAMYNGQFLKGFIHVVIFVMLIVATDRIHGLFLILVFFWVFYMAFDAYKTADAKRLGLPLPDPLGLDRLFGLQEGHPGTAPGAVTPAPAEPIQQYGIPGPIAQSPPAASDNVPVGAIVLIALGVLFLLGNFIHFNLHHFWPLILIGVGLWIAYKRLSRETR
jgi:hypothetical protein